MSKRAKNRAAREARANVEDPTVPVSSAALTEWFLHGWVPPTATAEPVTIDTALSVPAVWAAVNFIAGTIAGLPMDQFQRQADGAIEQKRDGLGAMLANAVNPETSSFEWRKLMMEAVLLNGRHITWIERDANGLVAGLWPVDPATTTIRRVNGKRVYDVRIDGKTIRYDASEVIDIPFMLRSDGLRHRSPVLTCAAVISMAQAATKYGASFFAGGAVPPFVIKGKFRSGQAMDRAQEDMEAAVQRSIQKARKALALPEGLDIATIGADPEKAQMIETQKFMVQQIGRLYSLPPVFLQDLSTGTFSNTEQQDLHFVKHTVKRWIEQIEQEMNLKLYGWKRNDVFVQFDLDGLLRGDFQTRMAGLSAGVQNALLTPNEGRRQQNLAPLPGGDQLLIQGATVPLEGHTSPTGVKTNGT